MSPLVTNLERIVSPLAFWAWDLGCKDGNLDKDSHVGGDKLSVQQAGEKVFANKARISKLLLELLGKLDERVPFVFATT